MLQNPLISRFMFLPPARSDPPPGTERVVKNVYESQGWYQRITCGQGRGEADPGFSTENKGRNIVISINVDGFQPWKRVQRSLTPTVAMILNLPENLRHKSEYLILAGLIPGPKAPKHSNPYMSFLIKELVQLNSVGFEFDDPDPEGPDSVANATEDRLPCTVRVKLLFFCADLPAFGDMLLQQHNSHHGCIKCNILVSACAIW